MASPQPLVDEFHSYDRKFDHQKMFHLRLGDEMLANLEDRTLGFDTLKQDKIFARTIGLPYQEHRKQIQNQLVRVAQKGLLKTKWIRTNPGKFLSRAACLAQFDTNLVAKAVIHYQLFGGSILELGTERHHKFLPLVDRAEITGGFAMTECGHGSNVANVETVATYDPKTSQFVINTPTQSATKFMIGNVAVYGHMVVLFARLNIGGEDKGVHPFLCPLRDTKTGKVFDTVEIGDCGLKNGWNGVDNAFIKFVDHKIPREYLLNRFADVAADGTYTNSLGSPSKLFSVTLSQLMVGRLLYVAGPVLALQQGLKIAIRYAHHRRQFGAKNKSESLIINYQTHKKALMPMLANLLVFESARNHLIKMLKPAFTDDDKRVEFHAVVSGVKAVVCEYVNQQLAVIRNLCGAYGFSAFNRIGELKNEFDIFQTAEGDRTVLLQQLAKHLLSGFRKQFKTLGGNLKFLAKEAAGVVIDQNPVKNTIEDNSKSSLMNPNWHIRALSFRVQKLLTAIAMRIKEYKAAELNSFDAWNNCLDMVIHLAQSYTHLWMLQQFIDTMNKVEDETIRTPLHIAESLFALTTIENDMGFFRNHRFFGAGKGMAIQTTVLALCDDLKEYSLDLVDSSEVDDELLDVPIAHADGRYVERMIERMKAKM